VRYAKALFESASEKNILLKIRQDIEAVSEICRIPEFQYMLETPVMNESQKRQVLDTIFDKVLHPLTLSLLHLVFKNGRELYIEAIARNFIYMYKHDKGIKSVTFSSAVPVSGSMKKQIENILQKALNTSIELRTEDNKSLIGGFVIRIDNQLYDASIATSLKNVKKKLLN